MVTVGGDRKIYINEYPVELDALGPKLAAIYRNQQGHQGISARRREYPLRIRGAGHGHHSGGGYRQDRDGDGTAQVQPLVLFRWPAGLYWEKPWKETIRSLYHRSSPRFELSRVLLISALLHLLVAGSAVILPSLHPRSTLEFPFLQRGSCEP